MTSEKLLKEKRPGGSIVGTPEESPGGEMMTDAGGRDVLPNAEMFIRKDFFYF